MKIKPQTQFLQIADFTLKLYSDLEIELDEGFLPFVVENENSKSDIDIECFAGISTHSFSEEKLVFEAKNEEQKFYSIYQLDDKLGFKIYDQNTTNEVQQIAILDASLTHWKVYSELTDNKINPLKFPLGSIIMHYMTLTANAVMMHASCAFDGKKGRIFSGFSGAGKSTISKLWSDAGSLIVNDDRLIIREINQEFYVFNTPMYYQDRPKKVVLNSMFLISHSPENKLKKLSGATAVTNVLAFCIQNNFDKRFIQNRLDFFSKLCSKVAVYKLGFVPDIAVVNFIKANETGEFE